MLIIGRKVEMVDSDIAALFDILEGNRTTNTCCATSYGCRLVGEEIEWHLP
jgi:hypothetical protein